MNKEKKKTPIVNVPEKVLLDQVASKFKGVALFPESLERAKKFLEKAKIKFV